MSDSESISGSDSLTSYSSSSNNSLFGEYSLFDELIDSSHHIYEQATFSLNRIYDIEGSIINTNIIIMKDINGIKRDFNEILEELHSNAMNDITANKPSNFGERLLGIL